MRRKIAGTSISIALFSFLAICPLVSAQTFVIPHIDRGWYDELGTHDPFNRNYSVGDNRGVTCSPSVYCEYDLRNFFVFDLAGVTKPMASATLALSGRNYFSPDPSETYELHDVTTSIPLLRRGTGGVAAWNDLGTGVVYGSLEISNPGFNAIVEIPLNSSAIAAMNSNHGLFAMGGTLTTLDNLVNSEIVFTTSGDALTTELRVTFVPEPSSILICISCLAGIVATLMRRSRPRS